MSNTLIAVYGSLRKGLSNHGRLGNSKLIGTFRSDPLYTLHSLHGYYPGLKLDGEDSVVFEVYSVTPQIDESIEHLEGYSSTRAQQYNHYDKVLIPTPFGNAYTYVYNPETDTRLEHGDWILFKTGIKSTLDEIEQEGPCEVAH